MNTDLTPARRRALKTLDYAPVGAAGMAIFGIRSDTMQHLIELGWAEARLHDFAITPAGRAALRADQKGT